MKDPLKEKTFAFAIKVVEVFHTLEEKRKHFSLSRQFLRSGTSPGAMIREAKYAESSKDFIHKLSIAQKEINETIYWIELLKETNYLNVLEAESLIKDSEEILKILIASIKTKKRNINH